MNIEELLKIKVSFQNKAWARTLDHELCLRDVFIDIKGDKYKTEIEKLRFYLEEDKKDKYDLHKKRLPGVTFCATFKDKRRRDNIKRYNKLIVIDIDKLNNEELEKIKAILEKDEHVLSYWESPSQKGIKGLVAINFKETISGHDINLYHKHAFKKLVIYFQDNYKLVLDESGSDTTRLCFLSYDPSIRIKDKFKEFEIDIVDIKEYGNNKSLKGGTKTSSEKKLETTRKRNMFFNPLGKNDPRDRRTIQSIMKYLNKKKISITGSYEEWFRVGYAIANTFTHDIGEKYFLKLCRLDGPMHDEIESKNILLYCYENSRGDISFSTIVYYAKKNGYII